MFTTVLPEPIGNKMKTSSVPFFVLLLLRRWHPFLMHTEAPAASTLMSFVAAKLWLLPVFLFYLLLRLIRAARSSRLLLSSWQKGNFFWNTNRDSLDWSLKSGHRVNCSLKQSVQVELFVLWFVIFLVLKFNWEKSEKMSEIHHRHSCTVMDFSWRAPSPAAFK